MSDIIVRFKPENHQELINAINSINKAQRGFNSEISKGTTKSKDHTKATGSLVSHNRLLNNSFATMRSNLLLVNFALGLGIKQLAGFSKEAAKLESVNRAFNTMTGSSIAASRGLNLLREATNNTMSDFDLFRQANSAMLLGITNSTSEMAEMFDMSQRLGRALGNDTVQSVEALIFGLGRMSVKRLDDIGIIVKANQAYSDYAAANNTVASQLTENQKRQAFFNAALESGRKKLASMGPEALSSQDKVDQLTASFKNLRDRIGTVINEAILPLTDSIIEFNRSLDSSKITEIIKVITSIGTAFAFVWAKTKIVRASIAAFTGVISAAKVAVVASVGGMTFAFRAFFAVLLGGTGGILALGASVATAVYAFLSWKDATDKVNKGLAAKKKNTGDLNAQLEELIIMGPEVSSMLVGDPDEMQEWMNSYFNRIDLIRKEMEARRRAREEEEEEVEKRAALQTQLINAYASTTEGQLAQLQSTIDLASKRKDLSEEEIQGLKALEQKKAAILEAETQAKLKAYSRMTGGLATLAEEFGASAQQIGLIQAAGATVDAFGAASSARFNANKAGLPPPIPAVMYGLELAAGLINARKVYEAATKVSSGGGAGGGGSKLLSFEEGGYVGGRRHSQGGTIIEAERGEFVMSRNAVESIGLETLNQMNQTGGGGSINVSVTGNVLTQDFVEGELAESIKEAIRRGSDFGIG